MVDVIVNGVTNGAFYIAIALGVVLVQKFGDTLNFAHAALGTLAAYVAFTLLNARWPYLIAVAVALLVSAACSVLLGIAVTHWFGHASHLTRSMATFGPTLAVIGAVGLIWDQNLHGLPAPGWLDRPVDLGAGTASGLGLFTMGALVVIVAGVMAALKWTRHGVALRAIGDSKVVAEANGINVKRYQRAVWAFAGVLGGGAALVITPANVLEPNFLTGFLVVAFTAAVIGGLSNLGGLIVGGLIFGVAIAAARYVFDFEVGSIGAFVLLLLVLTIRPTGLFSRGAEHTATSNALELAVARGTRRTAGMLRSVGTWSRRWRPAARTGEDATGARERRRTWRSPRAVLVAGGVALLALAPVFSSGPTLFVLAAGCATAVAVSGQNIASGLAGQLSLAQGGVMLFSAYAAALLVERAGLDVLLAIAVTTLIAAVLGVIISLSAARISGIYLAIVTMAFSLAVPELARNLSSLTNGEVGMITRTLEIGGRALFSPAEMYYASVVLMAIALTPLYLLSRSSYGQRWRAVRDSPTGAASVGIAVRWPRVGAFAVACAGGGFAGALITFQTAIVTPQAFTIYTSIYVLLAAALGGEESVVIGPIIGGMFITVLPYMLSGSGAWTQVIFGVVLFTVLALRSARSLARLAVPAGGADDRQGSDHEDVVVPASPVRTNAEAV